MNNFNQLVVDNLVYKISLAVVSLLAIGTLIFNLKDFTFVLFIYVPMGILYAGMYRKNQLRQNATSNRMVLLHTALYVLSCPALLLYLLAITILKLVVGISKWSTPKFGSKKKWW